MLEQALRRWSARHPPEKFPRVLEIGVGTGRMAYPVAAHGYAVVGADISATMLGELKRRRDASTGPRVDALRADATHLPLRSGSVDLAYWVHVLHLIPAWQKALDELRRVVRPGGPLLEMNTGNGREIPALMREYARRMRAAGYPRPRVGARRRMTHRYLAGLGIQMRRRAPGPLWYENVTVGEALGHLERRAYSATRYAPIAVHRRVMRALRSWARRRYGGDNVVVRVPNRIVLAAGTVPRPPARRRPRFTAKPVALPGRRAASRGGGATAARGRSPQRPRRGSRPRSPRGRRD
jgi:SAM-dependent methyltransferase